MSKLTKRYAKKHGVPLSKMDEGYLASEAEPSTRSTADTRVLRTAVPPLAPEAALPLLGMD
jgi:hypothetical protein